MILFRILVSLIFALASLWTLARGHRVSAFLAFALAVVSSALTSALTLALALWLRNRSAARSVRFFDPGHVSAASSVLALDEMWPHYRRRQSEEEEGERSWEDERFLASPASFMEQRETHL